MNHRISAVLITACMLTGGVAACAGRPGAAGEHPLPRPQATPVAPFAAEVVGLEGDQKDGALSQAQSVLGAPSVPTAASLPPADLARHPELARAGQMIIKHADLRLLVAGTDIAVDRATQTIGDLGGYIISSRAWYQDYYGEKLKYATYTVAVPSDQFENALGRLRGLAVRVVDETASGEDVTDQFVDLQSQVLNLESTRERIKGFLDQAQSVDEALRINQQLSEIEAQIEQLRGRMNYLSDRSAYSTITVNFEPEFPILTPTPTATPTATPTPRPWKPGDTLQNARLTVTYAYRGIAEVIIWLLVVVLPILGPPILLIWGTLHLLRRRSR